MTVTAGQATPVQSIYKPISDIYEAHFVNLRGVYMPTRVALSQLESRLGKIKLGIGCIDSLIKGQGAYLKNIKIVSSSDPACNSKGLLEIFVSRQARPERPLRVYHEVLTARR